MAIEIELKYLVAGEHLDAQITALLTTANITFEHKTKQLVNHYFETPDLSFRRHDMGLRVRESDGTFEQTIKTAGKVIGGLHQRPEFNIDIDTNFPELALFPQEIWGIDQDVATLQQKVVSIFTTNFTRNIWLIKAANGSEIELVFDQGLISSMGKEEAINELELELVSGQAEDIFPIAQLLIDHLALRPGTKSKAARGYALWQNISPDYVAQAGQVMPITSDDSIHSALIRGVDQNLQHLHYAVEHYLQTEKIAALVDITNILAILRHGYWLFKHHLGDEEHAIREEVSYFIKLLSWADSAAHIEELNDGLANSRKKVATNEALLKQLKAEEPKYPDFEEVSTLLHSARFNLLQLNLLKYLLKHQASLEESQASESSSSAPQAQRGELKVFAQQALSKALQALVSLINQKDELSIEQYINLRSQLHRSLLTGNWLGGLFAAADDGARLEYRQAWLDLQKGLTELQVLWVIGNNVKKLEPPEEKLVTWYETKIEGLLLALEHSRKYALEVTPYWPKV